MGVRNYYLSAKIEKFERGSQVTAKTGNTLAADRMGQSLLRWATRDGEC
jgi:hypothetical protein